jgi:hypothetical protein
VIRITYPAISCFERLIHRSGDSTFADQALPHLRGQLNGRTKTISLMGGDKNERGDTV